MSLKKRFQMVFGFSGIIFALFISQISLSQQGEWISFKWAYHFGGEASVPAFYDETIYVTCSDGYLYAITIDGSLKFKFRIEEKNALHFTCTSPSIGKDGSIYFGVTYIVDESVGGFLYAIRPDGSLKWKFSLFVNPQQIRCFIENPPAIGKDGTIYLTVSGDELQYFPAIEKRVPVGKGYLYALTPEGRLKWIFTVHDYVFTPPVIDKNGTIYFGAGILEKYLFAVSPNGMLKWKLPVNDFIESLIVDEDGTLYFTCLDRFLYAVKDGRLKWSYPKVSKVFAIGRNGEIYCDIFEKVDHFGAISRDGKLIWEIEVFVPSSEVTIDEDGKIYRGRARGLDVLDPAGKGWHFPTDGFEKGVVFSPAGDIIAVGGEYIYMILYHKSSGLAKTPWPTFQHDFQRTGRVE